MVSIYSVAFYCAIFFTVIGGIMGLMGVWITDFYKNDVSWKLLITNVILAVTSIVVAVITRFLVK